MAKRSLCSGKPLSSARPIIAMSRAEDTCARVGATAAMDLSDGLSLDLYRLCAASRLRAEISPPPVYRGATLQQALHGGEDYELLFTAPPRVRVQIRRAPCR